MLLCWSACSPRFTRDRDSLKEVMEKIDTDKNHQYLSTLQPTLEDCKQIFLDEEEAGMAYVYAKDKFSKMDRLPDDAMKAPNPESRRVLLPITKEELVKGGIFVGFSKEYPEFARKLRPGMRLFSVRYEDKEGKEEKTRASFFRIKDKWVFIPRPFMAFIREGKFD